VYELWGKEDTFLHYNKNVQSQTYASSLHYSSFLISCYIMNDFLSKTKLGFLYNVNSLFKHSAYIISKKLC